MLRKKPNISHVIKQSLPGNLAVKRHQISCHRPGLMHKTHVPFLNFRYGSKLGGSSANIPWLYWILDHLRKISHNKIQEDVSKLSSPRSYLAGL